MGFTVRDFRDLAKLLEQRPEWRAELRRLVLSDEILTLPQVVREIVEAQKRTEHELASLASNVSQLTARVDQLTARVDQLTARVDQLTARVDQLTARVDQLTVHMDRLAEAQTHTEERLARLIGEVGDLKGESLERRYRERAASFFQRILRRIHVVDHQQLGLLLDDAVDAGRIAPEDREDILEADVVVRGLRDGEEVHLLAEVSAVVDRRDVERAARRAAVLENVLGRRVLAAVAGGSILPDSERQARQLGVWRVLDGRTYRPEEHVPLVDAG